MTETTYLKFESDSAEAKELLSWWNGLDQKRGDRAQLRRCKSLDEIVFTEAYHELWRELKQHGAVYENGSAALAGILAHVKQHIPGSSLAEQMAQSKQGADKARLSGLRFRHLIKHQSHTDLYRDMIRVVHLLDNKLNVIDLARVVYWWNERTKKQMAYDYYGAAPTAD